MHYMHTVRAFTTILFHPTKTRRLLLSSFHSTRLLLDTKKSNEHSDGNKVFNIKPTTPQPPIHPPISHPTPNMNKEHQEVNNNEEFANNNTSQPQRTFVNKMFNKPTTNNNDDTEIDNEEIEEDEPPTRNASLDTQQKHSKQKQSKKGPPPTKKAFELDEKDLEEKFVIGSGPGGQHLNKTSTTCFLKHIPTGLYVKCMTTRSQVQNRKLAREMLKDKIDLVLNGKLSKIEQEREKIRRSKSKRKRRSFGSSSSSSSGPPEDIK